ncbi:HAMP domain-containing histidine kinase [Erysipelothrix sp. D19-032]
MIKNDTLYEIITQIDNNMKEGKFDPIITYSTNKSVIALSEVLNASLEIQRKERIQLRKKDERYRKMLSNISHDLNTPLTVIKGMLELIDLENKDIEKNINYIHKVQERVDEVITMMHYFFELNKIEAEDTHEILELVDIHEISGKILLKHYDIIQDKGLSIDIDIPNTLQMVRLNKRNYERVLDNLIQNALSYGYEGNVIGLRINETPKHVQVIVWDRGKGIHESKHARGFRTPLYFRRFP